MDKELKIFFKKAEKDLNKLIKLSARQHDYKSISNSLYKKIDGFFVHSIYFGKYTEKGLTLVVWNCIKTYQADDLFWTIFDMKSNIGQRDSLRANGAFVAPSLKISENVFEISKVTNLDKMSHEISNTIAQEHNNFIQSFSGETQEYNRHLLNSNGYLREKLMKMLANIELQDYERAKMMAGEEIAEGNRGGYQNNDKDIYQYILEYCDR
jgi:hypothetical protein